MISKKQERERTVDKHGFVANTLVESPESIKREMLFFPSLGVDYEVRVTAYENGPYGFYVQFVSLDNDYQRFQCNLQSMKHQFLPARYIPQEGSKCLALIENEICRVCVEQVNESFFRHQAKVRSLETGQKFLVNISNIYNIPTKIANVRNFAKLFKLAFIEKNTNMFVTRPQLDFFFQHITNQKLLKLRVRPEKGRNECLR